MRASKSEKEQIPPYVDERVTKSLKGTVRDTATIEHRVDEAIELLNVNFSQLNEEDKQELLLGLAELGEDISSRADEQIKELEQLQRRVKAYKNRLRRVS